MKKYNEIIKNLIDKGFTYQQILHAACDGEYLKKENIRQNTAEKIYLICLKKIKK